MLIYMGTGCDNSHWEALSLMGGWLVSYIACKTDALRYVRAGRVIAMSKRKVENAK